VGGVHLSGTATRRFHVCDTPAMHWTLFAPWWRATVTGDIDWDTCPWRWRQVVVRGEHDYRAYTGAPRKPARDSMREQPVDGFGHAKAAAVFAQAHAAALLDGGAWAGFSVVYFGQQSSINSGPDWPEGTPRWVPSGPATDRFDTSDVAWAACNAFRALWELA